MSLFSVEEFLKEVHKQLSAGAQGVHAIPTGVHIRDDEQVRQSFVLLDYTFATCLLSTDPLLPTRYTSNSLPRYGKYKFLTFCLQALYLLLQCGHNVEEAIRRRKMQAVPPTG